MPWSFRVPAPAKENAAFNRRHGSGRCVIDRRNDFGYMRLDNAPAIRRQAHEREFDLGKILLELKRLVRRHQDVETSLLGGFQQIAVLQAAETGVNSGECLLMREVRAKLCRDALVEQNPLQGVG